MCVQISSELEGLNSEEVDAFVSNLKDVYKTYKNNFIANKIDGQFLANCPLDEASLGGILSGINVKCN